MKINNKILLVLTVVLIASGFLYHDRRSSLEVVTDSAAEIKSFLTDGFRTVVVAPPPLRSEKILDENVSRLTALGVVKETNLRRTENGLEPLSLNPTLVSSAQMKLNDMFKRQYFDHVTPDGDPPSKFVRDAGYEFIVVGENLALGNYPGDSGLVEAWMQSPGHRDNILNDRYREIGVALSKGEFEGKEVWMAVQIFAMPLAFCSEPGADLKASISEGKKRLDELDAELGEIEKALSDRGGDRNRALVERYNALVAEFNNLLSRITEMVDRYNSEVRIFNLCVESG